MVELAVGLVVTSEALEMQPVTFEAEPSPEGTYTWNFGDGSLEEQTLWSTIKHTYSQAGVYTVELYVESGILFGMSARQIQVEPLPPPPEVVIVDIFFDGVVPVSERDEYVEIINNEPFPVELQGWRLLSRGGQRFPFPDGATIQPAQKCRIYTNQDHPEWCGFSFGSRKAVWNNQGDRGVLYDQYSRKISEYSY